MEVRRTHRSPSPPTPATRRRRVDGFQALAAAQSRVRVLQAIGEPPGPPSIVESTLLLCGLPAETLAPVSATSGPGNRHTHDPDREWNIMTLGALVVFRAMDRQERRGVDPGEVLNAARLALADFLDILPKRRLRAATRVLR